MSLVCVSSGWQVQRYFLRNALSRFGTNFQIAVKITVECRIPYKVVNTENIRKRFRVAFTGRKIYERTKPVEDIIEPEIG